MQGCESNSFCHMPCTISRSGDSTARIWTIVDGSSRSGSNGPLNVLVLKHVKGRTNEKSKDVTTLDWNVSFITLFCINCYLLLNPNLQFDFTIASYTIKFFV